MPDSYDASFEKSEARKLAQIMSFPLQEVQQNNVLYKNIRFANKAVFQAGWCFWQAAAGYVAQRSPHFDLRALR
jgi:hypothetical protein